MKFTKLIAIALIAASALCAVSCGKAEITTDKEKETNVINTTDTSATSTDTTEKAPGSASETETQKPDVTFGEPTDSFELPSDAEKIVGVWKLGGADAAALEGLEIWEFNPDGTFNMINTDKNGKISGNKIPGQYRLKDGALTVTMMGMPLTYDSYKFEDDKLKLTDHGSEMILEKYTGAITE